MPVGVNGSLYIAESRALVEINSTIKLPLAFIIVKGKLKFYRHKLKNERYFAMNMHATFLGICEQCITIQYY